MSLGVPRSWLFKEARRQSTSRWKMRRTARASMVKIGKAGPIELQFISEACHGHWNLPSVGKTPVSRCPKARLARNETQHQDHPDRCSYCRGDRVRAQNPLLGGRTIPAAG